MGNFEGFAWARQHGRISVSILISDELLDGTCAASEGTNRPRRQPTTNLVFKITVAKVTLYNRIKVKYRIKHTGIPISTCNPFR